MVRYNSTGIQPEFKFKPIREDWYVVKIINAEEGQTPEGYPRISMKCEIINNEEFGGETINYMVSLLPATDSKAWMGVKFLQMMGEEIGGELDFDPKRWEFKKFEAYIKPGEYKSKKTGEMVKTNQIKKTRAHGTPAPADGLDF